VELADGTTEKVWCTFDYEQIDLDVFSPIGRSIVRELLIKLARHRVKMLRVDAFGYTVKKLGTPCFFVEPETSELLDEIRKIVRPFNVEILPEIHEHHSMQLKLASQDHWVYDFALPLLVLQALYEGTNRNLINWLQICPRKQITTLDTHDGLPVVDVVDLMTDEEIERTREHLYTRGANVQRRYSTDPEYKNLDIYQINCTYYSALGDNDDAYILARAIQFFSPGVPQVYYVGLLAGRNDIELLEATKFGRNINRHNYSIEEIEQEINRPVIQRLMKLMKFRNRCDAFNGEMTVERTAEGVIAISWTNGESMARLKGDLSRYTTTIEYRDASTGGDTVTLDL
jgi:sucrose phosphorylase